MSNIPNLAQNMAAPFDTSKDYESGEFVVYDGLLYIFNTSHTAGAWNNDEVTKVTLADAMKGTVNSNLVIDFTSFTWQSMVSELIVPDGTKQLIAVIFSIASGSSLSLQITGDNVISYNKKQILSYNGGNYYNIAIGFAKLDGSSKKVSITSVSSGQGYTHLSSIGYK